MSLSLRSKYDLGAKIGSGGNGVVRAAVCKQSGRQLACKTIAKVSHKQVDERLYEIHREVAVMHRLSDSECVAKLEDVYEDADNVYVIMERCYGGELKYDPRKSERTTASQMRFVLQTLTQCHNYNILHRDVKPSNFLLLSDAPNAPVKGVDFGLSVMYGSESSLPLKDLSLEGTPWFMAPETISSLWGPPADVWAAGIMAHQLLTGILPFDDRDKPQDPRLTAIFRSILSDELDLSNACRAGVSPEGRDFVARALTRKADRRPVARELLEHPWLRP